MPGTVAVRLTGALALLLLAGLILMLGARHAAADFGDCSSPDYLARFDERFRTVDYDCVERLRVPVETRSGTRHIRILHDFSSDWLTDEAMLAQFDRGVRLAAEQLGRIGPFEMRDVTILLADDFPPRRDAETFTNFAAWTQPDDTGLEGECQIVLFLLGPGAGADHAATVIAHEIFHCVQKANLSPGQMTSHTADGHGGAWWMEGSAEWFASAAVPELSTMQDRVDEFDANSPTTPLFHMNYEAVPFFFWLVGERGETAVLPFLAGMADRSSDSAQAAAMRDSMSDAQWLAFAQAYLDGEIRRPRGAPVSFNPAEGDTLRWESTRTVRRPLQPFVLDRGWIECDCGTWTTSARPGEAHRVRPDGGAWGALPGRIDTEAGDDAWFRLAAINTGGARRDLVFDFAHEVPCEGCAGGGLDSCLAGQWRLTGGGAAQWVRDHLPPGVRMPVSESTGDDITFTATGGYFSGDFRHRSVMTAEGRRGVTRADGHGRARGSGRWSAQRGVLTLCPASERFDGQVTVTRPDGSGGTMDLSPEGLARAAAAHRDMLGSIPPDVLAGMPPAMRAQLEASRAAAGEAAASPVPAPGPLEMTYSCSGDTVRTSLPVPGRPPIVSTYARVR